MYSIRYLSDITVLENDWKRLERGPQMTYFQTYNWYNSLLPYSCGDCKKYESRYVALSKNGSVKVIAPIFVIKRSFRLVNKKGVYLIGYGGWSDYLNFIYDDASGEDIEFIINDINNHYGCHSFFFEDMPEKSLLYLTIKEKYSIVKDINTICIGLTVPETLGAYLDLLSKNTKQNLRTSANRLANAGLSIRLDFDDNEIEKKQCEELRSERLHSINKRLSLIKRLKIRVAVFLRFAFRSDIPFYMDANSHIMTLYINNELAAFLNYGLDQVHKRIVIMAVGTSEKYGRYSPGLLLAYEYIKNQIDKREIEVVDFTRGNEKYKYSLGGKEHYNHHVVFSI